MADDHNIFKSSIYGQPRYILGLSNPRVTMWLLSTDRAELQYFQRPEDIPGGYAILSHVWQAHEQTFQDIRIPRSLAAHHPRRVLPTSSKIRDCCALARAHGFKWVWIDTCCIDKTSSAELSEAINSMYTWYAQAAVCYAYLHDVPSHDGAILDAPDSSFRKSKWFTRGWTLQELIAPKCVIFLAQDWIPLGTKATWSALLEEITGVDADILTFERELADISIARRMSWASHRQTTRVEDEAYCLMGIFNINMPNIYGEGRQAFRRLQEEIMKQSSDQSLFAWGDMASMEDHRLFDSKAWEPDVNNLDSYLLAPSPAAFAHSGSIVQVSLKSAVRNALSVAQHSSSRKIGATSLVKAAARVSSTSSVALKVPEFTLTSHGVRMRLLVVELPDQSELCIAMLACQDTSDGSYIGLLLLPSPGHVDTDLPQFHVAITQSRGARTPWLYYQPYRLLRIHPDTQMTLGEKRLSISWREVYVAHRYFPRRPRIDPGGTMVVHFPRWLLKELRDLGFSPNRQGVERTGWDEEVAASWSRLWTRGAKCGPVVFFNLLTKEGLRIELDQCKDTLWATVAISVPTPQRDDFIFVPETHQEAGACEATVSARAGALDPECTRHHVDHWPGRSKVFGDADRTVRLSFSRWPHNGRMAYLADIRLQGRVYDSEARRRSYATAMVHHHRAWVHDFGMHRRLPVWVSCLRRMHMLGLHLCRL